MVVAQSQIEHGEELCLTQFSKDVFNSGHGLHISPSYGV